MPFAVGSDHAGFALKARLKVLGQEVVDLGANSCKKKTENPLDLHNILCYI